MARLQRRDRKLLTNMLFPSTGAKRQIRSEAGCLANWANWGSSSSARRGQFSARGLARPVLIGVILVTVW